MNEMVRPNAVIVSHANETATEGGKLLPGTRTALFSNAVKVPVHLPLSGKVMQFDGGGHCVEGC